MKILVVAAYDPELAVLAQAIAAEETLAASVGVASVGIGLVAAAMGAREAVRVHAPERVLLLGTCGAYLAADGTAKMPIGAIVAPAETAVVDHAIEAGKASGLPGAFAARALDEQMSKDLRRSLGNPGAARVATSLAITTDAALSRARGDRFDLEHLELSAVAAACALAGVPFAAILGIANACGETARAEWLANHSAVERALGAAALGFLRRVVAP